MSVVEIIRSFSERMPWHVSFSVFSDLGLSRRVNWDKTLISAEEGDTSYNQHKDDLLDALQEHLLCGEKMVRFYEVDTKNIDEFREKISQLTVEETIFSKSYPIVLSSDALDSYVPQISISAIHKINDGIAIVMSSKRRIACRKKFSKDQFADLPSELSKYNEFIGVSYKKYEAFDILWVPNDGNIIEIRADCPNGKEFSQISFAIDQKEEFLSNILGENYFQNRINFFPVIDSLYKDKNEGKVVELGFMVSGGAQKYEKSRRDGICCRVEAYHLNGIQGLAVPIDVYRIVVMWRRPHSNNSHSNPELGIHGRSTQTSEPHPFLTDITISKCGGLDDYNFVRERLLSHR